MPGILVQKENYSAGEVIHIVLSEQHAVLSDCMLQY